MSNDNTVYILDSYGLIYRAYFAFINRPFINNRGENVSAVFGFFRNFYNILRDNRPNYITAAFDSRTPTFRHKMYSEYKATRDKTPEDLHAQVPVIEEILQALGVPVLRYDGFEADDIIATIATTCCKTGRGCRILSGDKDLMQLVCNTTLQMKPDKTGGWATINSENVKEEWGVPPDKMLDLLSLTGDTADNIPGVKGIGDKTAAKLLLQYDSLDGIYAASDTIKGAMGEKLRTGKDMAYFSKSLIELKTDVPVCTDCECFKTANLNFDAAAELLNKHGVPSIAKLFAEAACVIRNKTANSDSLGTVSNPNPNTSPSATESESDEVDLRPVTINKGNYSAVKDINTLKELIDNAISTGTVAFDTETDNLEPLKSHLAGFSLCTEPGTAYYIPLLVTDTLLAGELIDTKQALQELKRLFSTEGVTVIMHNAKYDMEVLYAAGLDIIHTEDTGRNDWVIKAKILDTMIAAWLLQPDRTEGAGRGSYSLEKLAETKLLLIGTEFSDIVPKGNTFLDVPIEIATPYAAEDADFTLKLYQYLEPELEKEELIDLFLSLEMNVLPILADMEINGIRLESQKLSEYSKELIKETASMEKEIYDIVGHTFNIASPKQLSTVLFTELGLPPSKKTKSGWSTDTSVLEELAPLNPVPYKILQYRAMMKLLSTYVETLPLLTDKNERIHTSFIQTGTATGRLSSRDPNLQNIPVRDEAGRRIRSAFIAPEGKTLVSADYSQIELVLLAHLSNDSNLCKAFIDGIDVHKATAALIYNTEPNQVTPEMRRTAKTINFGVMYGMSAFRLSNELGISRNQAQDFISSYFSTYSGIRRFMDETISNAEKTNSVKTIFGRKRNILNINSKNHNEKNGAERIAINTPIQGSAADIVKLAMIAVYKALNKEVPTARMLLQVHDELIVECNSEDAEQVSMLIKTTMENVYKLNVPLKVSVEYGKNWGEFH